MKRSLIIGSVFAALLYSSGKADIIDVPDDYPTIQQGIDASVNGDTVLVAEGTYFERVDFSGKAILLGSGYIFSGDTLQIQNTIIDADTSIIGPHEVSSVVRFTSGEDTTSVVRGFTIRNGVGVAHSIYHRYGGGIYCSGYSSPKIMNNYIIDNSANAGGGVYIRDGSNAIASENRIMNNDGGGIFVYESSPIIMSNMIGRNTAENGGGIFCAGGSDAHIIDNVIFENYGGLLGGGIYCVGSNPTIVGNLIYGNKVADWGGGICADDASPVIINNIIADNVATSEGGGLYCFNNSIVTVVNTISWANTPPEISYRSGGSYQITFSDIRGGWEGQGDMDSDPFFISAYEGEYNVCSQSPCIDAGDPSIQDPDGTISDIGIYYPDHQICDVGRIVYVSTDGSDESGDGTAENPYRTIGHSIDEAYSGDTILVENGIYAENIDLVAKAIHLFSPYALSGDPSDIQNTVIDGGSDTTAVTVSNCDSATTVSGFTIKNGHGWFGGGVFSNYSEVSIDYNVISDNVADATGGGICSNFGKTAIRNNWILDNSANSGGGISCYLSAVLIERNRISNNEADLGGGLKTSNLQEGSSINNNVISANTAYRGGGYDCFGTSPSMNNNVFTFNESSTYGGGVFLSYSNLILLNSILWGNSAASGSEEIYADNTSLPVVAYCDIQGGWQGEGNIEVNPLFRDPANGIFQLMAVVCMDSADSPCIDAGHPDSVDIVLNCDFGLGGSRADMGAFGGNNGDWETGIGDGDMPDVNFLPGEIGLFRNYPNPFNSSTLIEYELPAQSIVRIDIYDILGRRIQTLQSGLMPAGRHRVVWDVVNVMSGLYFCRIKAGDCSETRKMVLLK